MGEGASCQLFTPTPGGDDLLERFGSLGDAEGRHCRFQVGGDQYARCSILCKRARCRHNFCCSRKILISTREEGGLSVVVRDIRVGLCLQPL